MSDLGFQPHEEIPATDAPRRTSIGVFLRWETLESNRDMPRATIPPPTKLRLYGIRQPR